MDDPERQLRAYGSQLADGVEEALPGWVAGSVARIMTAWAGSVPAEVAGRAEEAGRRAGAEVGRAVRDLLEADVDDQRTTPLAMVRSAVSYPTEVLEAAGVPPVERDPFTVRAFPADAYDLAPATFADLDPVLAEVAISWGAAKAFVHRKRHLPPEAGSPGG